MKKLKSKMKNVFHSLSFAIGILASNAFGQNLILGGRVVDAGSGQPLIGANVVIRGTVLGASTDSDGIFVIRRIPAGVYDVRVSMIGYAAQVQTHVDLTHGSKGLIFSLAETPVELNPVVITAERRSAPLKESSNSISVISIAEIKQRNNLRLDEALEMVPGVYFMKEDVSIRGSTGYRSNSANRVLLMVDDIPVMTSDIGGISWDVLPMLDIERIEVVKGAGSALWGSYAMGGVINVITARPSQEGRLKFRLTGGVYDNPSQPEWIWAPNRTLGYTRADVSYSKAFGNLGVRLSFSRHQSTGDRVDGDFEKWNLSASLNYRFRDASELILYAAWLRDRSGVFVQWRSPYVADSTAASPSQLFHPLLPDEEGNRMRLSWLNSYVKYNRPLSATSNLKMRASLLRSMLGNQFQVSGDFFPANGLGAEIQLDVMPHPNHFVTIGSEFKLNLVDGVFFGGKHREVLVAPFVQDEWRIAGNLRLTVGVRFDRHHLLDGPENRQINPRFGLNYQPTQFLNFRASSGRGFRVPTIAERTINFDTGNFVVVPNPDLEPESSWSYEFGIRSQFGGTLLIDAALFHNSYENLIEALPDLAQTERQIVVSFQNVPRARIRGFELSSNLSFWRSHVNLGASLTYLDSQNLALGQPLSYRPRWISQLSPSIRFGPVQLRADYRFASQVPRVEIYSLDQRVAQHELNLRLHVYFKRFALILGSNNILNYNYTQIERNLGEIRNFQIGLTGEF